MSYSFALIVTFGCILCNCILTYCYRDDPTVCEPVKDEPGCVCKTSDGKYISLLSLANPDLSPSSTLKASHGDFKYSYNPCYGVNMGDSGDPCSKDKKMAGCQQTNDEKDAYGIGSIDTEAIYKDTDGSYFISYTKGQDNRFFEIKFICDEKADTPKLEAEGDDGHAGDYRFQLTSSAVCEKDTIRPPINPSSKPKHRDIIGGIGIGLIALAIFGLITYFIVGTLINKLALKKSGSDIIPQKTFWFSLPLLIRDGVVFTFSPLIRLVKKDYQPLA